MNKKLSVVFVSAMMVLSLALVACQTAQVTPSEVQAQREDVRSMAKTTLSQLYANKPELRQVIARSAGYAVFSDFGFKFVFMGGGRGKGLAVNNANKQDSFMEMVELQPGLGLGASSFRIVLVFDTQGAFNQFLNTGWEFGTNAVAMAKNKSGGGAVESAAVFEEGVTMYQLNEEGLLVGVSLTGAKFYWNSQLN